MASRVLVSSNVLANIFFAEIVMQYHRVNVLDVYKVSCPRLVVDIVGAIKQHLEEDTLEKPLQVLDKFVDIILFVDRNLVSIKNFDRECVFWEIILSEKIAVLGCWR